MSQISVSGEEADAGAADVVTSARASNVGNSRVSLMATDSFLGNQGRAGADGRRGV
jgi:hypothetical protein